MPAAPFRRPFPPLPAVAAGLAVWAAVAAGALGPVPALVAVAVGGVAGFWLAVRGSTGPADRGWLLESAAGSARDGVVILRADPEPDGSRPVLYSDAAFTRMSGCSPEELLGRPLSCLTDASADPAGVGRVRAALDAGTPLATELLGRRKDGADLWVEVHLTPIPPAAGRPGHWVLVFRDVRDRRQAEEDLRERETRFRVLGDNLPDGAVYQLTVPPGGSPRFTYMSRGVEALTGLTPERVLADAGAMYGLIHPDDVAGVRAAERASHANLSPFDAEFRQYTTAGGLKWVHARSMPARLPDGSTVWNGVVLDVTDRRAAAEATRRNEERYRLLFDANPHPMWVYDLETLRFLAVNQAAVRKYGWARDEFLGMTIRDIRPPDDVPRLEEAVAATRARPDPLPPNLWRHRTKAGRLLSVEVTGFRLAFDGHDAELILASDVTQRAKLEDHVRQVQKMEAVGQMAGGIAHDFNNLLTAVLGNLSLVRLPDGDPHAGNLQTAERAAVRAAELTRKLLGFARRNQLVVGPVRADELVREVVELVRPTLGPRIEVVTECEPADPVAGDATLLNQALVNLCLNARDAMPAGGRMALSVRQVAVAAGDSNRPADAAPGTYVRVAVADSGHGMPPDVRARLFEPFFTTKPVGEGTGLGLAMVHGIVRQHGGWVECDTEVDRGTRFRLYLPRADATTPLPRAAGGPLSRDELTRPLPADAHPSPPRLGRTGTVLLVDDEDMIRDLGRAVLERAGFHVLTAVDGADAVDVFTRHRAEIDLVVMDLTMPRMSGREAHRAIAAVDPAARVVLSSGYAADDLSDVGGAIGLLSKPYRPADLVNAVRRALAEEPNPPRPLP